MAITPQQGARDRPRPASGPPAARWRSSGPGVLVLVVVLLVAACTSTAEEARPTSTTTVRRDLFGTNAAVVDDELWVFGGHAAEPGTAPPVTSDVPPGWSPNREVAVYAPDGSVVDRHVLQGPLPHAVTVGSVLSRGDDRYLLGTMCGGAMGCGSTVVPALFRLAGEASAPIELDLPPFPPAHGAGIGALHVLGAHDGTAFALQRVLVDGGGYAGFADRDRLVAIDLATGAGHELELPSDVYGESLVCQGGADLFAVRALFDGEATLREVIVMTRPATGEPADWRALVQLPFEDHRPTGGALHCLDELGEVALTLGSSPSTVFTFDSSDGTATTPPIELPTGLDHVLGVVDGTAIGVRHDGDDRWRAWRHQRGGPWEAGGETDWGVLRHLVLLGGQVVDASAARTTAGPDTVSFPTVEL